MPDEGKHRRQQGRGQDQEPQTPGGQVEISQEIAIRAATLTSPKGDLDKNMHKALKVEQFPDITFRLLRVEPKTEPPARAPSAS